VYSPSLRPATALRVRSARPPTWPMCRVPRHVRYTCQSASTYNICTAQSAVSTVRAFLYRVLAYAYPLLIRSLLGCWRSSCSPALKGRTTGRGPKTGLDSMYDAHAAASLSSLFSPSHRPMVDTTQAHSDTSWELHWSSNVSVSREPAGKGWLTARREWSAHTCSPRPKTTTARVTGETGQVGVIRKQHRRRALARPRALADAVHVLHAVHVRARAREGRAPCFPRFLTRDRRRL